jgi:tetratricopeptide (TPR) repeat protein
MITLTRQSVTIHRLVQAVARTPDPADPHRTPDAISQARARAEKMLLESLPENPLFNVDSWPRWRELLPHALALTAHIGPEQDTPVTASILAEASGFLQGDGHYGQGIQAAQRAVDACGRLQGPDGVDTLTARSYLASAYRAAGDLAAAVPLHQQNLADAERVLGQDHPQTLDARANLAYLAAMQHDEHRALELHSRNLAAYERAHGPDHPATLNARANLASSYRATGDLDRAIELHERNAADYARVFGDGHAETVTALSNLAYAYQLRGDLDRAIELHRRVLADRERLYGPDHHYTEIARQLVTNAERQASGHEPAIDPDIRLRKRQVEE